MSVILLLPKAEVEGNENDITQVTGIQLASIPVYNTVCNQLPVIKSSVSAVMHNVIGYYHEINLNISHSSFVVVVKYYMLEMTFSST